MLNGLKIEKHMTVRGQISNYLREEIMRGNLASGSRLPSIRELAKQWGTQNANIHAALSPLVKEGLLIRKHGVGTIVNQPEREFKTLAIYVNHNLLKPMTQFYRLLLENVQKELVERGIEARIIIETPDKSGFAILRDLAESRRIQGVVVFAFHRSILPGLNKLPVPFSCMTSRKIKNRVQTNNKYFIEKIIEATKQSGGRKLGIISSWMMADEPVRSGEKDIMLFYNKLFSALENAGIENRPEWNGIARKGNKLLMNSEYDKFAFEAFQKVWSAKEKPDCIFVYTDDLTTGTILSAACSNVKVPEEVNLIFHHHYDSKIFCPLPCCYIQDNLRDMAKGLIDLVEDQFHGKEISEVEVKYDLIQHQP